MKIMLIQPRASIKTSVGPPLGLGYLASCAEKQGHKVKILDATILNLSLRKIKKEIKQFDPDIVGSTAMTLTISNALSILKAAKENNSNCLTTLGGAHPTVMAKETLENNSFVDVIVRGEGELTFVDLIEKQSQEKFETIKGISYRFNGKITENEDRELIEDLDSIPFPAYHLLPMDKYRLKFADVGALGSFKEVGRPYGVITTSRGCPFDCIFCSSRKLWGRKWRARSAENVIEELKILKIKYGKTKLSFMDDTFTLNKERVIKICDLIQKEGIDLSWICVTRVDLFDKEIADALKKAGCFLVWFGLESGVQKTLDFLKKSFTVEQAEKAVKTAREAGLEVCGFFIIGVPGESKGDINKTINFASRLDLTAAEFNLFIPFPGTEIYEIAEENNLLVTKDWARYKPSNFNFSNYSTSLMKIPGFTTRELKRLRRKAHLKLNLGHLKS